MRLLTLASLREEGASAPQLQAIASVAFSQENDGRSTRYFKHTARIKASALRSYTQAPSPDFVGSSLSEGAFWLLSPNCFFIERNQYLFHQCVDLPTSEEVASCEKQTLKFPSLSLYKTKDFGISSEANSTARRASAAERYFFVIAETVAVSASKMPMMFRSLIF